MSWLNFLIVIICIVNIECYKTIIGQHQSIVRLYSSNKDSTEKSWPGNRPPIANMKLLEQRMDASWGRAKYRTEVWEDDVNPLNNWWEAYAPSEEQMEAIQAGYDFEDPKAWFEAKGIDYEKAAAETKKLEEELYAKYKKEQEAKDKNFSMEEFQEFQIKFFEMQKTAFEKAFRIMDDDRQAAKGQPSLDDEDTGTQWKNDPI